MCEEEGWRRAILYTRDGAKRKGRSRLVFCYKAGDETRALDFEERRGEDLQLAYLLP